MARETKLIVNLTRGNVVCEQVVIADRARRRMRGLLGRGSLPPGEGMLLQPSPSIHTAFMRFPIDVVFLDRNLRVIKLVEHLPPWHTASAMEGRSTLELSVGEIARRQVEVGDQLLTVEPSLAEDVGSNDDANLDSEVEVPAGKPIGSDGPARVLLVGTDRRFRSVAATLLARRGCDVTVSERIVGVAELAQREAVDVVVLDAGALPTAATLAAVELDALEPPVGVVLVSEDEKATVSRTQVLEKWGEFDALFGAISTARSARGKAGIPSGTA
jgi:uncharacterized membrane protein (UPF0127 family)